MKKSLSIVLALLLVLSVAAVVMLTRQAEAQLADTPWPMFRHDPQHTGRSPYLGAQAAGVKWSYDTGANGAVLSSPAIGSDGTIYVGSHNGKIYAFYSDNGTVKWSYATVSGRVFSSPAIGSDGTIYVGSEDKNLYAINADGTLKWSYATDDKVISSPAIGSDGTIYVGSFDNNLYAFYSDNGTVKWSCATLGRVLSSPAIGSDGTIYVGSGDNNLYAIYSDNGTVKWSYTTLGLVRSSPAIGSDGTIYVGSYDDKLHAIYSDNGTKKWSCATLGDVYSSPAIGSDGTIYVGSQDNKLYAIYSDNGTEKWSYPTLGRVSSSPAIGSDGTIYVGSDDFKLYAFYSDNGTKKWSYTTGGCIYYSSPAIGSDGTIYVGSGNNKLYALGTYVVTFDTVPANTGAITFDGANYSDGDTASKVTGTYSITANPAANYTFTRWETEGSLSVTDSNSATTTCTVSGDGTLRMVQTAVPDITVSPSSINFGSVKIGSSSSAQVTVTNDGAADLVIGTITIGGTNADQFSIQNDDCSEQTLAPGASATLGVVFSPTSTGDKSATLSIPSDDPDEATVNVSLSGTGVIPPSPSVGVEVYPPDKLDILAPWLGLASILALAIGGGILVWRRRRAD